MDKAKDQAHKTAGDVKDAARDAKDELDRETDEAMRQSRGH